MIFGIDPEHGDGRDAVGRLDRPRQLDGGQGLEQREDRTAEGAGLLAGGDDHGAWIGQPRGVGAGRAGRLPGRLLGGEGRGDRGAVALVGRDPGKGVPPGRRVGRIAGKGVRHLVEGVGDVEVERARPGEVGELDADGGGARGRRRGGGDGEA